MLVVGFCCCAAASFGWNKYAQSPNDGPQPPPLWLVFSLFSFPAPFPPSSFSGIHKMAACVKADLWNALSAILCYCALCYDYCWHSWRTLVFDQCLAGMDVAGFVRFFSLNEYASMRIIDFWLCVCVIGSWLCKVFVLTMNACFLLLRKSCVVLSRTFQGFTARK